MGTHQLHFIARMDHTLVLCLVFLAVTCVAATADPTVAAKAAKQCYNCGFRQQLPNGEKEKLPDTAECNDFATPEDITVNCGNGDDCCATLKEYFTDIDEDTGENSTVIIGLHGCESDLNHIGGQTVLCSDHTDACLNIDRADLPNHQDHNVIVWDMEICFCSRDRCNGANQFKSTHTAATAEPTVTPTARPTAEPTAAPSPEGCSDQLSFSPGTLFPGSVMTCYDNKGLVDPVLEEDTLLSAGTSCIFMSSGHLTEGLVMELFCEETTWVVSIVHV